MYPLKYLMLLILLYATDMYGQKLQGKITGADGTTLAYATIYVQSLQKGTASNEAGDYVLELPQGTYTLLFQYLGYRSEERTITVSGRETRLDVELQVQPRQLETVEVTSDREDPAYTIMRRAIAKAGYHTQQLDAYTATSYLKGSGRIKDVPWIMRKRILKEMATEGMDTTTAFVTESVHSLHYQRPNQFTEKVRSIRQIGEDNNTSPNAFIQSSFYEKQVNGAVSPLSPQAFAYYRFEYLGFFEENKHQINKIRVTPRSSGDQVFEGTIYIVDDLWCIHSLDLSTYLWGIRFEIKQVYKPIEPTVWLPVNHIFDVTGSFFGFDFEYQYFAQVSDYDITLNPDLVFTPVVIDDKLQPDEASVADRSLPQDETTDAILNDLEAGKDISRKKLRKVIKAYEEAEMEAWQVDSLEDVVEVYEQEIDTQAYRRDTSYWNKVRPIPLTDYEVNGYRVMDSLALVAANDSSALTTDSLQTSKGFRLSHIIGGATYAAGKTLKWGWSSLLGDAHFNTVEGYNLSWRPFLRYKDQIEWKIEPVLHYGFAIDRWNGGATFTLSGGEKDQRFGMSLGAMREIVQVNPNEPIDPFINGLNSLLFERNYMKLLQQSRYSLSLNRQLGARLKTRLWAEKIGKSSLTNHSDQVIFGSRKRGYTPNILPNREQGSMAFASYDIARLGVEIILEPWMRYRIRNGQKEKMDINAPVLTFRYLRAFPDLLETEIDYHQFELAYQQDIRIGVRGDMKVFVEAGTFIKDGDIPFPEFKHFPGNLTFIHISEPFTSFRLLDYYDYSVSTRYLRSHVYYQFRKLLLTQSPLIRLAGWREQIFVNYLETPTSNHYTELGWGAHYIFRFLRLESIVAFEDFRYKNWGIRLGVSTNFDDLFN